MFGGLPTESVTWWSALLSRDGLRAVEVIQWLVDECPDAFVGRPLGEVCAATTGAWTDDGERLRRAIDGGRTPPPPILVSTPDLDRLVILEGHNRMIGYTRLGPAGPPAIEVIVGLTTRAAEWSEW